MNFVEKLKKIYDEEFEKRLVAENVNFAQRRAVEIIERRDRLSWEVLAVGTTTIVLLAAGSVYKRKDVIIPIVPLIMGVGYRYDAAHGGNKDTIREEAENLLKTNNMNLNYVGGSITLKDVDKYRNTYF
ncbi:unnamed protein product [Caenorhabditis angaria]|uniref:Uncharacterized protein n=1 Tax=Caenorhabditis angaria TaxID=860376 RepID=A0A9P1IAE5_9PELO|nr:unnamed protein product [Caenorhabditis angaria]